MQEQVPYIGLIIGCQFSPIRCCYTIRMSLNIKIGKRGDDMHMYIYIYIYIHGAMRYIYNAVYVLQMYMYMYIR